MTLQAEARTALSRRGAHVALASVVVVWAGAFAAIKHLLDAGVAAPEIAFGRCILAAPGFVIALRHSGGLPGISRRDLIRIVVAGVLLITVYHVALNEGELRTTSGTAAVIVGTAPGMTLAFALFLGLEVFSARRAAGLAIAFAGVVVVVTLGAGQSVSLDNAKGPLLVLLAPISFAAYNVMAKPLIARHSPIAVSSAATLAGTVALLPFIRGSWVGDARHISAFDWLLVVYLGLVCTLFAYIAWTLALNHLDASRAVAYLYGVPPLAVVIGAVTLGEQVTTWLAAGTVLVVAGVALAQVRR